MVVNVVPQVAALAKPAQVAKLVVGFVVVKVGGSEDYAAAGNRVRLVVFCTAVRISRRAFAAVFSVGFNCPQFYQPYN